MDCRGLQVLLSDSWIGMEVEVEIQGLAASLIGSFVDLLTGMQSFGDAKLLISLKRRSLLADTEAPDKYPNSSTIQTHFASTLSVLRGKQNLQCQAKFRLNGQATKSYGILVPFQAG